MRKRVAVVVDGAGRFAVDLPCYQVVPGSYLPVVAGLIGPDGPLPGAKPDVVLAKQCTVEVDVFGEVAAAFDGPQGVDAFSRTFPAFGERLRLRGGSFGA